ncbi:MAG: cupin domain-containing protein [Mesorhizobium sp.]|uniref:cupin domain-containing protein n=1 Tax=unclassified Mesorhizobium TaxID=325217 RepID=UPI000FCAF593|nr:cupin domain-containing protein [Mesorhizobium sp. M5C.F.Cr.IN.023.01.1.1]RWF89811.1 MAG: cupin domain-containing protein [Mesorhizobium sp.]RWF95957.1 MAG: cupin domain-containing protein [Mesorhizobium sp.]RWI40951.1 MAG: cupin domain-containing protein [Mesorhizobium sp.]RWI46695.1 MAG: cupin domain-containing protein [Mesorhizobium sp.]
MGLRFIFMLTRNDRTVEDAPTQLRAALNLGVRHIGFKDLGLPIDQLKSLNQAIKAGGATSYLEVVSLDWESEIVSAKAAVEIGVDILLGGTRVDDVLPIVAGSSIQYFPFPGRISGHPSVLEGTIEEIVESAKALTARDGVHGLDLLAYRSREDVPTLIRKVCATVSKPVYVAGSIDTPERIAVVRDAGAAGFTIGTAALDGKYPAPEKDVSSQLATILRDVATLNRHISPFHKKNLARSFEHFSDSWSPKVAGQVNNMQVKLAKFAGEFVWHFHPQEDELLFVHKGRLLIKFRDRDEIVDPGEFIVVPHGVEHCPVALDDTCEVVLFEPDTTLNTGTATNERTVTELGHI